jgi:hypothetical protein
MFRITIIVATLFLFQINLVYGKEIDLTSPQSTFESCLLEKHEYTSDDLANSIVSNCFTHQGKLALLAYTFLGIAMLESFEHAFDKDSLESELNRLNTSHHIFKKNQTLEESINSLKDGQLNTYLKELIGLLNKYESRGFESPRKLEELVISGELAEGYVVTDPLDEKIKSRYKLFFKQTSKGWLISEIGNYE